MPDLGTLPLPFMLLTGFLGSGKTTLLNRVLADPSMGDTAVLINEFGAVGLDHLLVAAATDDVVLLESGCVCCSVGDDFGTALETLLERRRLGDLPMFRRVILETSGIADPGPIEQRVLADPKLSAQFRIRGVVTVVDTLLGERNIERFLECATQIAIADRLVLTKLDLATSDQRQALTRRLRLLNPSAQVLLSAAVGPPPEDLFGEALATGRTEFFSIATDDRDDALSRSDALHTDRYSTFTIRWDEPMDWMDFEAWLEALLIARGESILRIKGLLLVRGDPYPVVIQGVQHCLYAPAHLPAWPNGEPRTEIVFITRDFPRAAALLSFQQYFGPHASWQDLP